MKRYIRLLAIYVAIALAVVVLYAPWGLALRPTDISLLRAGGSIVCGIALAGVFGASTYLALKDPDVRLLEPSTIMDDDEVLPVLAEYEEAPFVGGIALEAAEQVRSAERKRGRLRKVISAQFSQGSMSWDKFANLVDKAYHTVLRNAALVANNVQSFDREGYAKERTRAKNRPQTADGTTASNEALALYEGALADMQQIIENSDRVLLEMGKLELEITKLESDDTLESASETVEELQALIEDTHYYR